MKRGWGGARGEGVKEGGAKGVAIGWQRVGLGRTENRGMVWEMGRYVFVLFAYTTAVLVRT